MKSRVWNSDQEALRVLEISMTRYRIRNGVISLARGEEKERVGELDASAIDYLCTEYDYDTDI